MMFEFSREQKINKLKEWEMYTPINDVIFKHLFGKTQNKKLLEGLIKAFLNLEVEIQEIQEESSMLSSYIGGKEFRVDVLAKTKEGIMVDIEVQTKDYKDIADRIALYPSRMGSNELEKGEEYKEVKQVISMWIFKNEFDLIKEDEKYITKWKWREESSQKVLTNKLEIDIVELGKIKKYMEEGKISPQSEIGMWTRFLLNPREIGEEEMKENETINSANQEYEKSMKSEPLLDDAFYFALKRWEDAAIKREARETGLAEGRAEGKKESRIEIAKMMLEDNKDIEEIKKYTGLTEQEINSIKI